MSVLLEALKKAAEEKQKNAEKKTEVSVPSEAIAVELNKPNPTSDMTSKIDSSEPSEAVSLTFTEASLGALKTTQPEVNNTESLDEVKVPFNVADLSVKQELSSGLDNHAPTKTASELIEATNSPETFKEDEALPFTLTDSFSEPDVETVNESADTNTSLENDAPLTFKLESNDQPSGQTVSDSSHLEEKLLKDDVEENDLVADDISEKLSSETELNQSEERGFPSSELRHHLEEEVIKEEVALEEVLHPEHLNAPTVEVMEDVPLIKAEESEPHKDYDWSLDQIPGYQAQAPETETEARDKSKRILQSSQKQSRTSLSKWVLVVLLILSVVLGLGYFGLIYYQEQNQIAESELRRYQLPKVQKVQPVSKKETSQISLQAPISEEKPAVTEANASNEDPMPENQSETVVAPKLTHESDPEVSSEKPVKNSSELISKESTSVKETASKPVIAEKVVRPASVKPLNVSSKMKRQNPVSPEPQNVRLAISSRDEKNDAVLGYEAFEQGNLSLARSHYLKAYEKDPNSLPALFGLGAVAAQKGEYYKALEYYRQILTVSPYHPDAETAIAMLESQVSESRQQDKKLKSLIHQNPGNARLQAAMGKRYAQKKDWVNAQEQYFKAFDLAPNNASYAINLAISLDRLGQYRLAKKYYEEGLALTNPQTAKHDTSKIKQRLHTLNQFLQRKQ